MSRRRASGRNCTFITGWSYWRWCRPKRNDPDFKMLVGRLSNAGVSRRVLQQTFDVDPKTIQRWGRALRSHNADELIRVLEGRKANRKLRPEIQAYVRVRWPDLVKERALWDWQAAAAGDPAGFQGKALAGDAPAFAPRVEAAARLGRLGRGRRRPSNRRGSPAVQPKRP